MSDTNFISSLHIHKLGKYVLYTTEIIILKNNLKNLNFNELIFQIGHTLQEIRIRALNHILSKLEHGIISQTDFSRYLELLKKLFEWFDFEPQIEEEKVLNLIYTILKVRVEYDTTYDVF